LALLSDGTLWAWGENLQLQLGTQSTDSYVAVPTLVPAPKDQQPGTQWVALAAGQDHSMALRSDGTLWTWGKNDHGQLGVGNTSLQLTPQQVPRPATAAPGTTWQQIAAGQQHSLALLSDGTLWAWGRNTEAQLGLNSAQDQPRPVQEFTRGHWTQIAGGETHSLALEQGSNRVFATGGIDFSRNSGQLGDGTLNGSLYLRPCLAVALPVLKPAPSEVSLYPNPAQGWVTLRGVAPGTKIQLRTSLGQLCRQTEVEPQGIDLSGVAPGRYWLIMMPTQGAPRTLPLVVD
jgi:hypothetical protein